MGQAPAVEGGGGGSVAARANLFFCVIFGANTPKLVGGVFFIRGGRE